VIPKSFGRVLLGAILLAHSCAALLEAQTEPPLREYQRTLQALDRYRSLAQDDDGAILPATAKPVEVGASYAGVPRLVRILRRLGDLPAEAKLPVESDRYAGALVSAVKRFQSRHGIDVDGRIGKATLAQLNTPLGVRVRQLELALERWRRVSYDISRPAIVVNIPEFRLRAFGPGEHPELDMKVVVGRARGYQTPLFSAELQSVTFRPYWNVPYSIQRKELVPQIKRDASYLSKNDFEVVTPAGVVVTTDAVSERILAQLRSGGLLLRQRSGARNALGLVKFMFPNEHDVYLHDTPARSLFARARRDFSHGCMRAEKAAELADWVLGQDAGWPPERVREAMNAVESSQVKLKHPIQVVIMYVTAVVLESGEVNFYSDIYGEDAALEKQFTDGL
jgi:L,D-transpeptidase YcbB